MLNLPFPKIAQIKQVCSDFTLDSLVLILTGHERSGGLLLYLDQKPLPSLPVEWQAKELSELQEEDFLTWDGLAVGFDPLSLQYPLLLTQGPYFYPIRHLFAAINRLDIYRENARKLALWLYEKYSEANLSDRFFTKLVELLTPHWLETDRPFGSVGLALDSFDLLPFLTKEKSPQWITLVELEHSIGSVVSLLTFEEVKQIIPSVRKCPHFIEWRPILWKNEKYNLLIDALDETAQLFGEKAEKLNEPEFLRHAYELTLEKWLVRTDTEHLVAVFPSGNFENFLKTGHSVIVKQMPKIYVGPEQKQELFTLIDLVNKDKRLHETISKEYSGTPFCINPLAKSLQDLTSSPPLSLEKILYSIGKASSLSTIFLSLANDFIHYDDIKSAQFSAEQIRNVALKGTYLLALGDPWNLTWRGRFNLLLDQAYAILNDALVYDEKASQNRESHLLREWYSLYQEKDLPRRLDEMQSLEQEISGDITFQNKYIFNILAGRKVSEPESKEISDLQNTLASWEETLPILTRDFLELYHEWYQNHQKRKAIEQNLLHAPPSAAQIEQLLISYRRIQRRLYALPHEVIVLQHLCSKDIDALRSLQSALQKEVSLQIHLLTDKIFLDEDSRILFEIQNIGGQDAGNIELHLNTSPQYEILREKASQHLPNLPAHTGGQRLEWHIRANESGLLKIHLKSTLSNIIENKHEQFEFSLSVIRRNEKLHGPSGGNPFQAGDPVTGNKFFGRSRELKSIFDYLLYGTHQPVLLRGPRRMGKSSILHQIQYLLKTPGELQRQLGYDREDEIKIRLNRPILTTLQGTNTEKDIPGWYFDLLKSVLDVIGTTSDSQISRSEFDIDAHRVFGRYIKNFLDRRNELRLVILLDEWDEERHLGELGGKLRALMNMESRLNWVISSTWMLSAEMGRFGSPFYGQTKALELKEMPWENAKLMVENLSAQAGVFWHSDALVALLDQTSLRPYLIQSLGQDIIKYLRDAEQPYNLVDIKTVQAVINDFVRGKNAQNSHFAFLWEDKKIKSDESRAHLSWLGRLILLTLVQDPSNSLKSIEIRNFLRAKFQEMDPQFPMLDSLEDDLAENLNQLELIFDVIKKDGDRYAFGIPLAQGWFSNAIRQYDNPWQFAFERLKREYSRSRFTKKE